MSTGKDGGVMAVWFYTYVSAFFCGSASSSWSGDSMLSLILVALYLDEALWASSSLSRL